MILVFVFLYATATLFNISLFNVAKSHTASGGITLKW